MPLGLGLQLSKAGLGILVGCYLGGGILQQGPLALCLRQQLQTPSFSAAGLGQAAWCWPGAADSLCPTAPLSRVQQTGVLPCTCAYCRTGLQADLAQTGSRTQTCWD